MNAITYGFYRLYLRCACDEDFQLSALERIERREKDTLENLAAEVALAEVTAHEAVVPAEPFVQKPKAVKRRPGQNLSQKSQVSKADRLDRTNAVEDGEKTADRVIDAVTKKIAKRQSTNGVKKNPRKKKTRPGGFVVDASDDDDDDDNGLQKTTTLTRTKSSSSSSSSSSLLSSSSPSSSLSSSSLILKISLKR